ncbi:MAG: hypothetical protein ACOY3P_20120 [Planctomycetota bacterium]
MGDGNRVLAVAVFLGRVAATPELRRGVGQQRFCHLLLDVGETLSVLVRGERADAANELLTGERVLVQARICIHRWKAGDGGERERITFEAENLRRLDGQRTEPE